MIASATAGLLAVLALITVSVCSFALYANIKSDGRPSHAALAYGSQADPVARRPQVFDSPMATDSEPFPTAVATADQPQAMLDVSLDDLNVGSQEATLTFNLRLPDLAKRRLWDAVNRRFITFKMRMTQVPSHLIRLTQTGT